MRQYKEYDNRERRKAMKNKRIRQVFERRNNLTRYEIICEEDLETLECIYHLKGNWEKYEYTLDRLRDIKKVLDREKEVRW